MSEIIERVEIALGELHLKLQGHGLAFSSQYARAAIEAMCEPTVEMTMAGAHHRVAGGSGDVWRAMIDAALCDSDTHRMAETEGLGAKPE